MKNLLYTAINKKYLKLFKYFYHSFRKYDQNCDLLCITDNDTDLSQYDLYQYKELNFDPVYTAKFLINKWERLSEYENILYLDSDVIIEDSLDPLFEKISSDIDAIHCVKEGESLNRASEYHNFDKRQFSKDVPAFNAGTFGFNIKSKEYIKQLVNYMEENKQKAICDQPIFNIFLYGKIKNSFDKDVHLFDIIRPREAKLVHLLGSVYNPKGKLCSYKRYFLKPTQISVVSYFNGVPECAYINDDNLETKTTKYQLFQYGKHFNVNENDYSVQNEYYDFAVIKNINSANSTIDKIRKIYPKIKKGGIISCSTYNYAGKDRRILKEFIEKSGLDYFQCYDDDAFFTFKL